MAKIHERFAGRGQVLLGNVVKLSVSLLKHARRAHHRQMFHGAFVAAPARLRQFGNRPRLAARHRLEHFPSPRMSENGCQQFKDGQRLNR